MSLVTPATPVLRRDDKGPPGAVSSTRQLTRISALERLEVAATSTCGKLHTTNEDAHSDLHWPFRVLAVADGVGSGAMPATVSHELVARIQAALENKAITVERVRNALLDADAEISALVARETHMPGAATVALCARVGRAASHWLLAWVGDCRIYRVVEARDDGAEILTSDDTYRHLSEQPPSGVNLDAPARMIGNGAVGDPNIKAIQLRRGEMLLLCSDGVHKYVNEHDIARLLRASVPLARRCTHLIELARGRGSDDDATIVVIQRHRLSRAQRVARLTAVVAVTLLLLMSLAAVLDVPVLTSLRQLKAGDSATGSIMLRPSDALTPKPSPGEQQ